MLSASLPDLRRLGGHLCLDFVNTIDPRYGPDRRDYLPDYAALLEWAALTGALPADDARAIDERAAGDPRAAAAVHRRALRLRDDLHSLLRPGSVAHAEGPLATVNQELRRAGRHVAFVRDGDGYRLDREGDDALDAPLWPVCRSAAELMLSPGALRRVRECDGHNCGWLFLDTSKAGRRRWCSMEVCGNRVKARRYRSRARGGAAG